METTRNVAFMELRSFKGSPLATHDQNSPHSPETRWWSCEPTNPPTAHT